MKRGRPKAESSLTSMERQKTRRKSIADPTVISSSSSLLTKELKCSICLDVFCDPVSTPCGHSFCKTCLNKCWDDRQFCKCPYCKETFKQRPDLKINITLQELVDHHKKNSSEEKAEVLCDICEERKLKALKSCLVCQSSYCKTHLEPHLRVAGLKKHKLMDPVSNLEDFLCQKHERPLELFCRDDQTIVCLFCTDGDHKNHNTVALEETQLMIEDVQQMIQDRIKRIQDVKHSAKVRKRNTEEEKATCVELFTDLIDSTERCQAELLEMMEKQQKRAEEREKEHIEELEQEIAELKMRNTKLQQLSQTEDLLQIYSSLRSPKNTRNWPEISVKTHESMETLKRVLTELKDTLDEKLVQTELMRMQQYAVDVTLDPDTAHPNLILSDDRRQVRLGNISQNLPDNPKRFTVYANVLGKEGFSSGRFYFEVKVKGNSDWILGVVRESINRKEVINMSPGNGHWTVGVSRSKGCVALLHPPVSLSLRVKLERVGVFVDYEEGLVSFYDVESGSHIYTYTGQTFTGKLYPFFDTGSSGTVNSSPLIITQLQKMKYTPDTK